VHGAIETEIRSRLRATFGITLPRFDLMAQLERHPEGLRMGELSKRMMVTGGNVTGIADQLEQEGWWCACPIPRTAAPTASSSRRRPQAPSPPWPPCTKAGSRTAAGPVRRRQNTNDRSAVADEAAPERPSLNDKGVPATITLNRPERKNPLTFDSYAELRDLFRALKPTRPTSRRWSSPAPAATSAPAATCTRSSAR
jgi:hypothetical protein